MKSDILCCVCDCQSVSLGIEPHLGLITRYLLLFDSYDIVFIWRPLWWEDGSVFCICCWPLSAQSFSGPGPESLGARDHILLSPIWDFPFPRLLRLTGSRWRYSTLPSHGFDQVLTLPLASHHWPRKKHRSSVAYVTVAAGTCLPSCSIAAESILAYSESAA
jgi:hypothetical protein